MEEMSQYLDSPDPSAVVRSRSQASPVSPQPHCSYRPYGSSPLVPLSPQMSRSQDSDSDLSDVTPENIDNQKPYSLKQRLKIMRQVSEDVQLKKRANSNQMSHLFSHGGSQTMGDLSDCEEEIGMMNEIFRPAKTPLEIPYLQNRIFNYLTLKDLKSCRLVSKSWRSASLPQMRRFRLNLTEQSRLSCLVGYEGLWEYVEDPGTFCNFELPSDVSLNTSLIASFFDIYGPYIKALVIPNNGWNVQELQNALFNKLPVLEELKLIGDVPTDSDKRLVDSLEPSQQLTKLKRLFLHFTNAHERALPLVHAHGYFNSGTNGWTKRLVSDLLSIAPNLEVVRCSNKRDMMNNPALCHRVARQVNRLSDEVAISFSCVNQFLAQKLFSRQHDTTPKLVNLDLYLRLNDRGMEKLEQKMYPLQALDLHVRYFDKQNLISLLRSLGKTLKFLRLRVDRQLMVDFSLDFFTELETLHLEDYAGNLLFLGDMPKLHTFILDKFDSRLFTRKEGLPCFFDSKITTLTLDTMRPLEMQGKCIKRLSTVLPNIRDFTLKQVRNSDLLRIFDCIPLLEHLKLVVTEKDAISDCGFSGFTDADAERILDPGYECQKYVQYEKMRRLPYIGDLKNLKTLALEGNLKGVTLAVMNKRMISSQHGLWILHGICNLRHLRSLSIEKATLSSLEIKQLVNKMNLFRLELHNCDYDLPMERYIRRKTFCKPFEFVLRKDSS